jgi:predicted permease
MQILLQDLRYGARMLLKQPGFTMTAVLTLALGIGANTAIFGVLDALLLRKLPVKDPDELVTLEQVFPDGDRQANFGFADYARFQELAQVFASVSATTWMDGFNVAASDAGVDEGQARVSVVTGNFFSLLGVGARLGRAFTEEDDRDLGARPVAVISDAYWERRFHRAPDVLGRTLTLNGAKLDIIGVTPRGFSGDWTGWPTDFWVPVAMQYQVTPGLEPGPRGSRSQFKLLARLKPGVTIQQAQAAGQILHQQMLKDAPFGSGLNKSARFYLASAATGYSTQRDTFKQPVQILMWVVGVVLLIACANVANLLLARAAARRHEIAVRLAIGAGRWRVVRQLMTESLLLALLGGALGLLLAAWGNDFLGAFARSGPAGSVIFGAKSVALDLRLNARVFTFTAMVCLVTTALFGLAPALRGSRVSLISALGGRGAVTESNSDRSRLRKALVIVQVALSLVLLTGAAIFVQTLRNLKSEDLGLNREHTLLVWTQPGQTGLPAYEITSLFWTIQDRLAALPGIVSASASVSGVLTGGGGGPVIRAEGAAGGQDIRVNGSATVGPRYFATLGQPLLAGREFTRLDADPLPGTERAPRAVIVNESLAHRLFGDENPLGRRLLEGRGERVTAAEIVGVVKDGRYRNPREADGMVTYWPVLEGGRMARLCLVIRAAGTATSVAASVRQELRALAPALPVLKLDTIDEQLDDLLFQERLVTKLAAFFGALTVLLACLGLYGLMSYTVTQRTREIGVRLALGVTPAAVFRLVLRESLLLTLIGIGSGLPLAAATTRMATSRIFGVSAGNLPTLLVTTLMLMTVALLACWLPARRATRVDPLAALRSE